MRSGIFDFYLMHAQNKNTFRHFKECHACETAFALKTEGEVRHVAGTQWGSKKYMNMKHLEAALDDASIAG